MAREIHLDGGEITLLKAVGFSGARVKGHILLERLPDLEGDELLDTLNGLLMFGHLESSSERFSTPEDIEKAAFWVNPSRAKELREVVSGRAEQPERRRRRG